MRLEYRRAMEIAVVGAAALVTLDGGGRCAAARIALTAVAPTCVRATRAEEALRGAELTAGTLAEAGELAAAAASPIDDVRAPADYRKAMVPVIVRRALERATERARKGAA
jgi:carbon-monoxide dehydrogenase medium subunit